MPTKISIGKLLFTFLYILIFPALLLFLSGNWLWTEGLIFSLWFIVLCVVAITYLYIKNPALLAERYKPPGSKGQKKWDIVVVILLVIGFIGWIILMPLDAERYKWTLSFVSSAPFISSVLLVIKTIGGLFLIPSAILFLRSYMDNPYLSGLVRIQEERKHHVVTTGVYGIVRHPMYLGAAFLFIGAPLLMGSLLGLAFGMMLILLVAARSIGEEKMLADELEGYEDYQKKVKYRIIPFVW
jgi:protein-S-isoprenylcysteine O-methyltransferase Ste14